MTCKDRAVSENRIQYSLLRKPIIILLLYYYNYNSYFIHVYRYSIINQGTYSGISKCTAIFRRHKIKFTERDVTREIILNSDS